MSVVGELCAGVQIMLKSITERTRNFLNYGAKMGIAIVAGAAISIGVIVWGIDLILKRRKK